MQLTLSGYSHLAGEVIRMAQRFCEGKIVYLLEGGYNLDALRYGVSNIGRLLLGEPPTDPLGSPPLTRPEPDIAGVVTQLQSLHRL